MLNHKKGRLSSNGQERSNDSRASRTTSQAKRRALEAYYTNRIYKKLDALVAEKLKNQKPKN